MSELAFWVLMLLLALFVVAVVLVGMAVRMVMRRTRRMLAELQGLSSDITDNVQHGDRG